jgi:hypothetical protein
MSTPDIRWYDDLDLFGADTADDSESLQQDCYHVVIEDPASNLQDPDSGLGIANSLSGVSNPAMATLADEQIAQDVRVTGVQATFMTNGNGKNSLDLAIQPDPDQVDTTDTIKMSIPIVGGAS